MVSSDLVPKDDIWDDPDLVPPPVFPTYGEENSQEMIVENNSSLQQTRGLALRSQLMSDEGTNYMGGLGQIPEALNTLSPTESRV